MNCTEAQRMIKPYLDKKLTDQQMQAFLDHVQHCPDCYEELEIYMAIFRTLRKTDERSDPDDYNFEKMLEQDIVRSRAWLRRKRIWRMIRVSLIAAAQMMLIVVTSFWIGQERPWSDEEENASEIMTETITDEVVKQTEDPV